MSKWIRPARPDDMDEIVALHEAAFGGRDEGRIARQLDADGDSVLSLVASDDNRLLGHLQFFRVHVDGEPVAVGLGPMSTLPEVQRSGIGSGLIQMGLMALEGAGESIVFVLGHTDYYPKFGFSPDLAAKFEAPWAGPAFMALALRSSAPEAGRLTFPAAFG